MIASRLGACHCVTRFICIFAVEHRPINAGLGRARICKPDLCNFVCNIEQYCTILAICTIYKNSCNMYNMYNIDVNIVHKIACNIEQYGEQYYLQF